MSINRKFLPPRLLNNHRAITSARVVQTKVVDDETISELRTLLNDAQAQTEEERTIQKTIQFLYRQNAPAFYKFLVKNKMAYAALWTESKCIVRHFGLQGLVYIRWNHETQQYDIYPHKALARNAAEAVPQELPAEPQQDARE